MAMLLDNPQTQAIIASEKAIEANKKHNKDIKNSNSDSESDGERPSQSL